MHQTLVLVPKSMTPYYTVIHGSQCYHFMFHVYWFLFLKKLFCLPIGHGTFISLFCELHQDISKTFDLLYHLLFTLLSFSFRVSQVIWHTQIVGLQALVIGNMFWLTCIGFFYLWILFLFPLDIVICGHENYPLATTGGMGGLESISSKFIGILLSFGQVLLFFSLAHKHLISSIFSFC